MSTGPMGLLECQACCSLPLQVHYIRPQSELTIRTLQHHLHNKYHKIYVEECRKGLRERLPRVEEAKLFQTAYDQIDCRLQGIESDLTYLNAYSGQITSFPPGTLHPRGACVDAIFPFGIDVLGSTLVRDPDNIAVIPSGLNHAKHTQLPIFLDKLGQYCRDLKQGDQDVGALQESFIADDCTRFRNIRVKAGWSLKSRHALIMTRERLSYLKEEWVSGQFHPGHPNPNQGLP